MKLNKTHGKSVMILAGPKFRSGTQALQVAKKSPYKHVAIRVLQGGAVGLKSQKK
jgi:hypothetical protein